jgi:hypothetical protein
MDNKKIFVFFVISVVMFVISFIRGKQDKTGVVSSMQVSYFFLWRAIDNWVDLMLYPTMIDEDVLDVGYGFCFMVCLTFILNTTYIKINNNSEEDWTFMGLFTRLRDNNSQVWLLPYVRLMKSCKLWWCRKCLSGFLKFCRKTLRLKIRNFDISKPLGFILFSAFKDSFYAMNFLYHKKANLRDKKICGLYVLSHVISNLVWLPVALSISFVFNWFLNLFQL